MAILAGTQPARFSIKGRGKILHVVACIKQVPDTKIIKMNPKTNTMDRRTAPAILNPYDAHAVEEAVRLKNRYGGIVSVVTMVAPPAVTAIKKFIEIGPDEGYLITDSRLEGADTLATLCRVKST